MTKCCAARYWNITDLSSKSPPVNLCRSSNQINLLRSICNDSNEEVLDLCAEVTATHHSLPAENNAHLDYCISILYVQHRDFRPKQRKEYKSRTGYI